MTDKQIIEEDMVNAKDFCPHYSCQVDCYEARMRQWFVDTLQQLEVKEQEARHYLKEAYKYKQALQDIEEVIKKEGYINKKTQIVKGSILYQAIENLKLPDKKILKIIERVLDV